MKKMIFSFITFFLFFVTDVKAENLKLYLFHSETCPHCASEREFLDTIEDEYKDVEFIEYEITRFENNMNLLKNVKITLGDNHNYVPYTVIGKYSIAGFNENTKASIREYLDYCLENECEDVVAKVKNENGSVVVEEDDEKPVSSNFTLPFFGEIDAKDVSLPIIAIVIGFIDGFNPCAMWILIFLISMLLGMKDKKRMWIIGLTFLGTSALVYLLFMVAWLKVALSMQSIVWIRLIIAFVALIGGFINLRSFIKMNKEKVGCTVTNREKQKKTMEKIKKFTSEKSFILAILGVITLAVSVNFIELACSAGLPLVFTQILAINELTSIEYALYIFLYILFFLLDDLVVFCIAMFTLKITGITNKYNKYSHLIGGIIMLIIGILLIFKPEILMFNF